MSITYQYVDRAKCECGYIWTTIDSRTGMASDSVVCACGSSQFIEGELSGLAVAIAVDDAEFKQAVSDDTGIDVDSLIIEQSI